MNTIYINVPGSPGGGGPSVFVYKTAQALSKRGYTVRYDKPNRADIALCIIETGKTLRKINRQKTRVVLRIDGIYCREYWHGGPGRQWRGDMTALHNKLKTDVPNVDHMVYQSHWSKTRLDEEIVKRPDNKWSRFTPHWRQNDEYTNLFHIGKMRNDYILKSLIGTYQELERRGHKVRLVIAGNMDAECSKVYKDYKSKNIDPDFIHLGAFPNTTAHKAFSQGDIYLGPRMGSSCDNVIVEALACGLPVVIPKWGGNSELIEDGVQGVVVDSGGHWNYGPDYIQKLADGVEKIIPNTSTIGQLARQHAVKNFTIDKMVDKYLKAMGL
jgi:glycosyltransferase involved in cell wall biosynthesis